MTRTIGFTIFLLGLSNLYMPFASSAHLTELSHKPSLVAAYQEEGYFFDDRPWPDQLLVIGSEADQNYFAVSRASGKQTVFLWSHEDGELRVIARTLSGYVKWLVRWWNDIRHDSTG